MRITTNHEEWRQAREALDLITTDTAARAAFIGEWFLKDLAAATGIASTDLRKIEEGKRPTRLQIAALKFAALEKALNL